MNDETKRPMSHQPKPDLIAETREMINRHMACKPPLLTPTVLHLRALFDGLAERDKAIQRLCGLAPGLLDSLVSLIDHIRGQLRELPAHDCDGWKCRVCSPPSMDEAMLLILEAIDFSRTPI